MSRRTCYLHVLAMVGLACLVGARWCAAAESDGKMRIIAFGAHPDDCEIKAGGCGAMWEAQGHQVKFVSATNGDIGHWREAGGPLAQRRAAEAKKADEMLGITSQVLDIHDGELMPTLENRRTVLRIIREWRADIVLTHRPNDYHPDHRYTGVLVGDAAYLVAVPFFCPETPRLRRNPLILYYSDRFTRPNTFRPDVVVSIDSVVEKKLDALAVMESQFLEGGCMGHEGLLPKTPEQYKKRRQVVRDRFRARCKSVADKYREQLIEFYGEEQGRKVRYAEAFEVSEYGSRPSKEQIKRLFPFFSE